MKCETCGTAVFKGPDGHLYHARNVSRQCWPGSSSDAVATAPAKQAPDAALPEPDVHIPDDAGAPICLRAGLGAVTSEHPESVTCRWCKIEIQYR